MLRSYSSTGGVGVITVTCEGDIICWAPTAVRNSYARKKGSVSVWSYQEIVALASKQRQWGAVSIHPVEIHWIANMD
jgi:hypothetical protein